MAKFGQQFIQGLLQPTYGQGLFTAAQQLGAMPRQIQQKRQEQQMLGGLIPGSAEYNEALAKLQMQRGQLSEASTTGMAAQQQRAALKQTASKEAARQRLIGLALKKAAEATNPEIQQGRVKEMTFEELQEYLKPEVKPDFTLPAGSIRFSGTGREIAKAPMKDATSKPSFQYIKNKDQTMVTVFEEGNLVGSYPIGDMEEKGSDLDARLNSIPQIVTAISDIDRLLKKDDLPEGVWAQVTRIFGGTEALDTEAEYSQLKNLLGLEEIAMLKKLGGGSTGLGAVSNIELQSLQNKLAYLSTLTSEELQREALQDIKRHFTVLQNLAAGVPFVESIPWNDEETAKMYAASGFTRDPNSGIVIYRQPVTNTIRYYDPSKKKFVPFTGN